jgi:dipicolinate synthase subunit A
MKIALLPGDTRQRYLGELLGGEGHDIVPYAPGEGADAWLFPLPTGDHPALEELRPGSLALVGQARGRHPRLRLRDYYSGEEVQLRNAAITAEGAIAAAIAHTERTLLGSRILILGGGRISRALAPRLRALGAAVTVYARRSEERALAESAGCETLAALPEKPEGFHLLFNTVPFPLLDSAPDCPTIELASAPGGFRDRSGVIPAGGLPGKTAPCSAAEALLGPIRAILREESS